MSAPEGKRSRSWFSIIMMVFLCILWSVPTVGLLVSSFRPRVEVQESGWWTALFNPFSADWTFSNYSTVLTEGEMDLAFINSIVVAIPATILPIMFAAFAAYAFTFMSFRGKDFIFVLIVALMVVPIQAAFVPLLTLFGPDGLGINGACSPASSGMVSSTEIPSWPEAKTSLAPARTSTAWL
jgi:alpha-glucoside transport system permease protein